MQVFLIHGMGRSRVSMLPLALHLRSHGHTTSLFGYSVARRPLDAIADAFLEHLQAGHAGLADRTGHTDRAAAPYAIIGHSLGNIVTRSLTGRLPAGLARFVMLAPPNHPPALARAGRKQLMYRLFTGDAGRRLGDPDFYATLPRPDVPSLIIAGNRSTNLLAFRGREPNDGIVSVAETRLEGVPHRVVPAVHTLIMNHPEARALITRFLEDGGTP